MASNKKSALNELEDAATPSHPSALDALEPASATPTPTGLPALAPTDPNAIANNPFKGMQPLTIDKAPNASTGLIPSIMRDIPGLTSSLEAVAGNPFVKRMITDAGGMTAGAGVGQEIAGIPGGIVGSGVGNVVGGEVADITDHPERAKQVFNLLFNPATPDVGTQISQAYAQDPVGTAAKVKQELEKVGVRFSEGAVAQIIGYGLGSMVPGVGGALDIGSKEIPGLKTELESAGYTPTADVYTKSKVAQVTRAVADKGLLSSDAMRTVEEGNQLTAYKNLNEATTQLAGGIKETLPPSTVAKMLTNVQGDLGQPLQREIENGLYKRMDAIANSKTTPVEGIGPEDKFYNPGTPGEAQGTLVPMQPIKDAIDKLNSVEQSGKAYGLVKSILNKEGRYMSFSDMHDFRSSLGDVMRNSSDDGLKRVATKLYAAATDTMSSAAQNAGEDVYDAWRTADTFTRQGKEIFNRELVSKLFLNDSSMPERVGRNLMSNGNTDQIVQLKGVLDRIQNLVEKNPAELQKVLADNPEMAKYVATTPDIKEDMMFKVKAGTLQDLINPHTTVDPKALVGHRINYMGLLQDVNEKVNPEGYMKLKELFGQEGVTKLEKTVKEAALMTEKNPQAFDRAVYWMERVGGLAIGGGAGAVIGHPVVGAMAGEAGGLFGAPKLASYILTDPKASELFLNGVKKLNGSGGAAMIKEGVNLMVRAAMSIADRFTPKLIGEEEQ